MLEENRQLNHTINQSMSGFLQWPKQFKLPSFDYHIRTTFLGFKYSNFCLTFFKTFLL